MFGCLVLKNRFVGSAQLGKQLKLDVWGVLKAYTKVDTQITVPLRENGNVYIFKNTSFETIVTHEVISTYSTSL